MSDTSTDTAPPVIRREIIDAQHTRIATLAEQLQKVRVKQIVALADATTAEQAVNAAIERAAETGADPDPAVMMPFQQAQATVEMHTRMVAHLERLHAEAKAGLKPAQHYAHVGLYAQGVQKRIEAAAKIEAGLQMAIGGKRDHDAATATIQRAVRLGVQHPQFNGAGGLSISMPTPTIEHTTEESEREFWAARNAVGNEWPHTPDEALVHHEPNGLAVAI